MVRVLGDTALYISEEVEYASPSYSRVLEGNIICSGDTVASFLRWCHRLEEIKNQAKENTTKTYRGKALSSIDSLIE